MKKAVLGCFAVAAMVFSVPQTMFVASAQDLPKLSEFLAKCYRDSASCKNRTKDFVAASVSQKSICLPKDVSINEAVSETLRWVKAEDTHPAAMNDAPYDDALYAATTKLYPCEPPVAEPAPAAEPVPPTAPSQ